MTSKEAICIAIKEVNKVLNGINKRLIKCNNLFVEDDYKYYNSPENLQKALDKQSLYIIVVQTLKSIKQDLERLEKLEKVIEVLKRMCLFEFEEETIYQQDEWADCYIIYITQFNNGFNKEEYDLLKEVLEK